MTSSVRRERSSSAPSSTSHESWLRLWRNDRSFTDENTAALNAKSRNVVALTIAKRSLTGVAPSTIPASTTACASSNSSAHHNASFKPGAIRHEQRDRDDVEEHEEQQRAARTAGGRDDQRQRDAVDQHGDRHERRGAFRCAQPEELGRARRTAAYASTPTVIGPSRIPRMAEIARTANAPSTRTSCSTGSRFETGEASRGAMRGVTGTERGRRRHVRRPAARRDGRTVGGAPRNTIRASTSAATAARDAGARTTSGAAARSAHRAPRRR